MPAGPFARRIFTSAINAPRHGYLLSDFLNRAVVELINQSDI